MTARTKTAQFVVTVTMPEGHSKAWVREYIKEAVEQWSGQYNPESPILYFCAPHHGGKTTVRHLKEKP